MCSRTVRRAWDAWARDARTVVVFLARADAELAAIGCGLCPASLFSLARTTAAAPPKPLGPYEQRLAHFHASSDEEHLSETQCALLELDPQLLVLRRLSPRVRALLPCVCLGIVCEWWPEGSALAACLGETVGPGRPFEHPADWTGLPRPVVERVRHAHPVREIVKRMLCCGRTDHAELLELCRAASAVVEEALPADEPRVLLVVDRKQRVAREGVTVVELEALLSGKLPQGAPWCVVFLVESLVEYTERLVAHALGERATRFVAHTWTPDGDAARADGWAPGPTRADEALRMFT